MSIINKSFLPLDTTEMNSRNLWGLSLRRLLLSCRVFVFWFLLLFCCKESSLTASQCMGFHFSIFFFTGYFLYLHFKCYSLAWSLPLKPLRNPLSHPPSSYFYEGVPPPTHPLPPPCPQFPYTGASIQCSEDQTSFLHWCMTRPSSATYAARAMCTPLFERLVPGSSWKTGCLILLFFLWGCNPLDLHGSFL
jgi:hypothetical protein